MKLTIAQSALEDLQNIKEYYLLEGAPQVGLGLVSTILKKTQRLIDYPDLGRKVPEFNQETIREIIHPPFRLVYLRDISSVHLIRVWRSERLLLLPESIVKSL